MPGCKMTPLSHVFNRMPYVMTLNYSQKWFSFIQIYNLKEKKTLFDCLKFVLLLI